MNLFLWLRFHLPLPDEAARIGTVRLRLDAMAVKIVFPARQLTFKRQQEHWARFQQALRWVRQPSGFRRDGFSSGATGSGVKGEVDLENQRNLCYDFGGAK